MSPPAPGGRLQISIDALPLADSHRTGIGRYLESVLPLVVKLGEGKAEFRLFAGKPICSPIALRLIHDGKVTASTGNLPSLYAWQQTILGLNLRHYRPNAHFTADGLLPIGISCPSVGVVHDMIWKRYPETASWHIRAVFASRQRRSLQLLTRAMTDSESTKRDLIKDYGPVGEKARVVPLGVDPALFHPAAEGEADALAQFRGRYGLPEKFLLALGNLRPHKNLRVIFRALAGMQRRSESFPDLAVIGAGKPEGELARDSADLPAEKIHWLGFLPDADVQLAYRAAHALVFPSLYEGFGFPILESMASGTPVLHSGTTSLPEVAGDAGLVFDPNNPDDLAAKLRRVMEDDELRRRLVRAGLERSRLFTWEACAKTVWESLLEAATARP